jgi:hypothetical protein
VQNQFYFAIGREAKLTLVPKWISVLDFEAERVKERPTGLSRYDCSIRHGVTTFDNPRLGIQEECSQA